MSRRVPTRTAALVAAFAALASLPAARAAEPHLADVRQLTHGGENAEAYWSPDGSRLIFQRTGPEGGCDQIFLLDPETGETTPVSSGRGRTTCAYVMPGGERLIYATTEGASAECPAPPDRSRGYVWPVYGSYEIVIQDGPDGEPVPMTDNDAYDAEATVCPVDGSIVFTSDRDGDLELYRMDADGGNVTRLTEMPGYDGGAFFSADCTKLVWRASRPQGEELEEFRALLADGLVKPGRLELWVGNADGSDARQITYLGAASFAPFFYPDGERVIFSSNWHEAGGREFDLWAVDVQGTRLERITDAPGFDGFPMFSPDGTRLAFGTNRFPGAPNETNVALARWVEAPPVFEPRGPDRYLADVAWLADDAREGRGIGTPGLAAAADWLEARFREIGLEPGFGEGWRQPLQIPVAVKVEEGTRVAVDGRELAIGDEVGVTGFSGSGEVAGAIVPAGYGIVAPEHERDDYAGLDVEGKVVLVRRFVPAGEAWEEPGTQRRYGDLHYKAFTARERGAVALLVVDLPEGEPVEEAPLPSLRVEQRGDAGIPVLVLTREVGEGLFAGDHRLEAVVRLSVEKAPATNVVGRLLAGRALPEGAAKGPIVVGAHYDHLGWGGPESLAPDVHAPHNGADDNASGVAAMLEAARLLAARRGELGREVVFAAFAGEETGLVGSTWFVKEPPAGAAAADLLAMVNFDMVGRLRENRLSVLGGDSAVEWASILEPQCREAGIECTTGGEGYGPSDHTPFYAAGVPVIHLFTGAHEDYHKPSDDAGTINAAGGARIASLAASVVVELAGRSEALTYQEVASPPPPRGDVRSYGASLGTVPDYVGLPEGEKGVLLAGVRAGSAAERAGLQRGDILVGLAGQEVANIYDLVFILRKSHPGQDATVVVMRDGERLELPVTFEESRRR